MTLISRNLQLTLIKDSTEDKELKRCATYKWQGNENKVQLM